MPVATLNRERTILYVEDDELTRQSVGRWLRRHGFCVAAACSGEEAMQQAESADSLAAVLLDVELPGIDGVETYRRLRALYPKLPVLICSARLDQAMRRKLEALGLPSDHLLAKPCPPSTVVAAVERAVGEEG